MFIDYIASLEDLQVLTHLYNSLAGSPKKERICTVRMGGASRRPSLPI